jgi:hypothetical protein
VNTPLAPFFKRHGSWVVPKVTWVGPTPEPFELQANPAGTLATLVPMTVKPTGRASATNPSGWLPEITVTVSVVGTPSVSVVGETLMDQGVVAALTGVGPVATTMASSQPSTIAALEERHRSFTVRPPGGWER